MMSCRICRAEITAPAFRSPAPALSSINSLIDVETAVYSCEGCGHAQSPDLPDLRAFYDTVYRVSLQTDEHDQIFAVGGDGKPVFRTDHQAAISLRLLNPPQGAHILDYGAAKADTLRKMLGKRPDIVPHVFDVSSDYKNAWQGWVAPENQATYDIPESWAGRFDAAMSHFAIEHVADPLGFLQALKAVLKPGGRLLLSLPDVNGNPGDMAVADHLNHFSEASLRRALVEGGFAIETIDTSSFPGAFFATAISSAEKLPAHADGEAAKAAHRRNLDICRFWENAHRILGAAKARLADRPTAIYGAGFYGTWIAHQLGADAPVTAFLDQNPNLHGTMLLGRPVLPATALAEDVRHIFVGLNPLKARAIIGSMDIFRDRGIDFIWLDDEAAA